MGKAKEVQETPQQRALVEIGRAKMDDWRQRWLPVQKQFADRVVADSAPDSFARRRAATMSGVDTTAQFATAADRLDQGAAATHTLGSARQKLAITGMGDDLATSTGLSRVATNSAVDDATLAGLGTVASLGQGQQATAISGMQRSADISARQAEADAQRSLENRMGDATLAGKIVGAGAGLWQGSAPSTGIVPGESPLSQTGSMILGRH